MEDTNPAGVPDNTLRDSDAVADVATHLEQSGILDQVLSDEDYTSPKGQVKETETGTESEAEVEVEEEEEVVEEEDNPGESEETSEQEEEIEEVEDPVYTVKHDGKVITVTLDELTNGYQRQSDYTQKTQELSQNRKAFEVEAQAVAGERQQYQQALGQFNQMLAEQNAQYEQIDWNELAELDPTQFLIKKEEQRELKQKQANVQQEDYRVRQLVQNENNRKHQEMLDVEWGRLEDVFPDWKVPEKREKLSQNWENYAVTQGYDGDEVKGITDHRALKILNKAMLYDKIQKAATKKGKVVKVPKTVKSGVAGPLGKQAKGKLKTKMQNLRQTGSVDAAASVFFDMDL
jgi:hypothetical protein